MSEMTSPDWRRVERHASIYPSVNLCGICLWVFHDGTLAALSFASMPMSVVSSVLERFEPDSLVVEPYRAKEGHPVRPIQVAGITNLKFVSPKWRTVYTRIPNSLYVGRLSPFVHRAFSIGFRGLIQEGPYRMSGRLPLEEYSSEWMDRYGPWRAKGVR